MECYAIYIENMLTIIEVKFDGLPAYNKQICAVAVLLLICKEN